MRNVSGVEQARQEWQAAYGTSESWRKLGTVGVHVTRSMAVSAAFGLVVKARRYREAVAAAGAE